MQSSFVLLVAVSRPPRPTDPRGQPPLGRTSQPAPRVLLPGIPGMRGEARSCEDTFRYNLQSNAAAT